MPPIPKRLGRPPGSKNKKPSEKANKQAPKFLANYGFKLIKSEDVTDDKFACNYCNEVVDGNELQEHIKIHKKNKEVGLVQIVGFQSQYMCHECRKRFRFKNSYEDHLVNEHSKLPNSVACDQCNVKCPNEEILKQHIEKVHERDLFLCPTCNKEFVRRSHVIRHMAQSGCDGKSVPLYSCEICSAKFTRKDNLVVHLRSQHILKNVFQCKQCDYETKNFSKLVNHWHLRHSDTPKLFQCEHCGKMTSSRGAMTKHLEIHGEKKFYCDVCGYNTFTIEVMRRHVWTHVPNKPFKCKICNQSYIQRSQLERHLEKHTGNVCSKCGDTFTSKAKLVIHQRGHMGLKKMMCPFEDCSLATKEFSSEARFDAHLKKHMIDKPFSCEVCKKDFHSELNMRRHLSTHTLDRPRRCMYCVRARAYGRGEQLVRHVRKQHPDVFRTHLHHVRKVLGQNLTVERVVKSELESILNVMDAEADRILQGYVGSGVLYGGMQLREEGTASSSSETSPVKKETKPIIMQEDELAENLKKLLLKLIDKETLELIGWPDETVDVLLERVIEHCGAKPADRERWGRVQRLRENAKYLFLHAVEDETISRMLDTHTIDQIITRILHTVDDEPMNNTS